MSWSQLEHKPKGITLDTPRSYFAYGNHDIFTDYTVFKKRPQGKAILKRSCLQFGTLKGLKHSSKAFPRASWLASIFDHFLSCFKMCLERQHCGQKVPQQPQKAARRLSGEGGERHQNRPKSGNPPKTRQTPQKGDARPPSGTNFFMIRGINLGYFELCPKPFCGVTLRLWKHVNTIFFHSLHTILYWIGTFEYDIL